MSPSRSTKPPARRLRGTREQTEEQLVEAVLRLVERDGVLAGINLREVAAEAGVNHGQIYQYFGTRQALLRAAITRLLSQHYPVRASHWDLPYAERKKAMWRWALRHSDALRLQALLALDNDDVDLFPDFELTQAALQRDLASGTLPPGADAEVIHALTSIVYIGYATFRTSIAKRLGIGVKELDRRAEAVYHLMLKGVSEPQPREGGGQTG